MISLARVSVSQSRASRSSQFARRHVESVTSVENAVLKRINIFHFFPALSDSSSSGLYGIFSNIPELALILTSADSSRYTPAGAARF